MRWLVVVSALLALGCGETSTGGGGAGGAPPPPSSVDQTCRDWCANEAGGSSCHQGSFDSIRVCYEDCLDDYQREAVRQCGDEWIAIKRCQLDLDCADLFGDCAEVEADFDQCEAPMPGTGGTGGTGGFNGQTICASDNSDVGQTIDCPSGEATIDFCVITSSGDCYYLVGGEQIDCGNCLDGGGFINTCAQEAVERCQ